jgi:hypothetical protein
MHTHGIVISEIRQLYTTIYEWHERYGQEIISKIVLFNQELNRGDGNLEEYQRALNMPYPDNASLDEMLHIAKTVQYGVLEWNYQAKVDEERILGDVARSIIILCTEYKNKMANDQSMNSIYYTENDENIDGFYYFDRAIEVYKHIPLDDKRNLGGRVALVDTNWEIQRIRGQANKILFRKPVRLNLAEVKEEDNLFQLASEGKISIISISVK